MEQVQEYATGTALAKTAVAGGGTVVSTPTPDGNVVPSSTPDIGGIVPSNTPAGGSVIPSSAPASGNVAPTSTIAVVTDRPAAYTLQAGEFPYCIARRFNVDPMDLLNLSGLSDGVVYPAGTVLRIPQSGSFPGDLALRPHPTTYTVTSSDETFYSIACLFGNVHPSQIAQANGIALGSPLTVGLVLQIP
jgi:LysM repeat protein